MLPSNEVSLPFMYIYIYIALKSVYKEVGRQKITLHGRVLRLDHKRHI